MTRRSVRASGRGAVLGLALIVATAAASSASITWGPQAPLPRPNSWNYGNALDATGEPGTARFLNIHAPGGFEDALRAMSD